MKKELFILPCDDSETEIVSLLIEELNTKSLPSSSTNSMHSVIAKSMLQKMIVIFADILIRYNLYLVGNRIMICI